MAEAKGLASHIRHFSARVTAQYDPFDVDELRTVALERLKGPELFIRSEDVGAPGVGNGLSLVTESGRGSLVLFSEMSQFEVEFYDAFEAPGGFDKCLDYVDKKCRPLVEYVASKQKLRFVALMFELRLPFAGTKAKPEDIIGRAVAPFRPKLEGELKDATPYEFIQKIALVSDDTYFVNVQLDVYETRNLTVRFGPNVQREMMRMANTHLYQTKVTERGIRILLDINTKRLSALKLAELTADNWKKCRSLCKSTYDGPTVAMIKALES